MSEAIKGDKEMNTQTTKGHVTTTANSPGLGQCVANGAFGGLVGGMIFGMMMSMLDMIGTIAMLVNSKSTFVGWLVHLSISIFLGAVFGLIVQDKVKNVFSGIGLGTIYGIFWWVLGGLVLMPSKLHMDLFTFNTMAWQSLMGHMVFGAVLGALAVIVPRQMHK